MRTLQSTIKNGRGVWNSEALPREEFQARLENVRKQMTAEGFDLLFVYGKPFDAKADPCYLSNFVNQLARGTTVVVPSRGEPVLMVDGFPRGLPTMRSLTWIQDVRVGDNFALMLSKYLSEGKSPAASIGVAGARPEMPYAHYRELRRALASFKVTECDDLVASLRRFKSEREASRIREAGRAVQAMFASLGNERHPGMTELALHTGARLEARLRKGEDVRFFLSRPQQEEWSLRPAEKRPVAEGERLFIYAAVEVDRYWAEAARTFIVQGNRLVEVKTEPAAAAYQSMLAAAMPGAKAETLIVVAKEAAEAAGVTLADDYGFGNGVGLALDEAPAISGQSADPIQSGMAFSLRLFTRDGGGWLIGDTALANPHGIELVTRV